MPGGLLQLVAYGAQNIYLNGNPKLSFFKKVYKTHTNFSMESIRINLNKNIINFNESTTVTARIDRNADMINNMYFVFSLPTIFKCTDDNDVKEKFNYVRNIGEMIIESCYINIGGNIIDKQYGEWMHIWNELSIFASKRYGYDKLIGNVPELYSPDDHGYYEKDDIQIYKRKIYVPLKFWFNKTPGLALPLISMQYHQVDIVFELRPFSHLFTINDKKPNVEGFRKYFFNVLDDSQNNMKSEMYLDINYIFLDTDERTYFAINSLDYLIEQVTKIEYKSVKQHDILDLQLHNPVKELIWVLSRDDKNKQNRWFDYIDWDYHSYKIRIDHNNREVTDSDRNGEIMRNAKIMFNGLDRIEIKDNYYYNLIQPYQHHTFIPKEGIYVYSFSLYPENFQPSGCCNMSQINKIQLYLETIKPLSDDYKYDISIYAVNYNFLRITAGLAGLAYAC